MRKNGWDREIFALVAEGVPIVGICGGFQMLGKKICDPARVESLSGEAPGLGLLDVTTTFNPQKTTWQARGEVCGGGDLLAACKAQEVAGYEIHMGESVRGSGVPPAFRLRRDDDSGQEILDGAVSETGLIFGTYLHGLFDADEFRRTFLNQLRLRKGLFPLPASYAFWRSREEACNKLARLVRENLDMARIYQLLGLPGKR